MDKEANLDVSLEAMYKNAFDMFKDVSLGQTKILLGQFESATQLGILNAAISMGDENVINKFRSAISLLSEEKIQRFKTAVVSGTQEEFLSSLSLAQKESLLSEMNFSRNSGSNDVPITPEEQESGDAPITPEEQEFYDILTNSINEELKEQKGKSSAI